MKEPFDIWWDENMTGFGVSDELRKLLANAFTGGMEASSGMKSVSIKKMSYTDLKNYIGKGGFDPHHIGEPEIVAIWPLPPSMAKDRIHPTGVTFPSSPTEKLRSFMGDVKWGDVEEAVVPFPPLATPYDPASDTWKTSTGSSVRTVGSEVWHTTETYDDMSREERDQEMERIADLIRAKVDARVFDKISKSTERVEHKLAEHQNEHIIAHRQFVEAISSKKDKILSDKQRVVLAKKKKKLKDKAIADRIGELAKIFEDKNERA